MAPKVRMPRVVVNPYIVPMLEDEEFDLCREAIRQIAALLAAAIRGTRDLAVICAARARRRLPRPGQDLPALRNVLENLGAEIEQLGRDIEN